MPECCNVFLVDDEGDPTWGCPCHCSISSDRVIITLHADAPHGIKARILDADDKVIAKATFAGPYLNGAVIDWTFG